MRIRIDAREAEALARAWARAPEIVTGALKPAVVEASLLVEREARERAPVGATALLRGSISARAPRVTRNRVEAVVASALPYAAVVELGRRPGKFPPLRPIADWARAKFGISDEAAEAAAWPIARAIARRGTKPARFFAGALAATRPQIQRLFEAGAAAALRGLAAARS